MTNETSISTSLPAAASPSAHLLADPIRLPVEQLVSEYTRRAWRAQTFQDLIDLASHHCGILSDGTYAVFAKFSPAANGLDQFEVEMAGLQYLAAHAGVLVPRLIGAISVPAGSVLVMEAAQAVERTVPQWREIGRTLARIHRVKANFCGFGDQGYFGSIFQDNRPLTDWVTFYIERRLWPSLAAAINAGKIPSGAIRQVEQLINRLPALDIPPVEPALLHGDAQQNNYISTASGAVVIDPAVFYGSPEFDLAHLETFQEVPRDVFDGYQEEMPIDPGFYERRELWRVAAYLLCVALEGGSYLPKLNAAVQKYL